MALLKRKTRKKLSKDLTKLVRKHGPEMALALVSGIISAAAAEHVDKKAKKVKSEKPAKASKAVKPARIVKAEPRPIVMRKRAVA